MFTIISLVILSVVLIVVLFFIGENLTRHIYNLREGVEIIAGGNLDYRVGINTKDEIGWLSMAFDEMVSRLNEYRKELESFSYSVSHDLRAPLRAIDGFSNMLLDDYRDRLDDEGKRLLNVVRDNTKKMGQLIDDILHFSHMGRKEITITEIGMDKLVSDVYAEIKASAPERKLQFNVKPLPPAYGDPAMLRQVVSNLLSNAVKFTREKDAAVIEVGSLGEEAEKLGSGGAGKEQNIYYVKDNGCGFDTKYADKLFGVFQRLHSMGEFEGTGIGLAIVQRIITRHGGRVWAEGKVGEGAVFYFTLPKRQT
ncbi:MAG: HAMP domain-containing protein [Deltaproteobacteria bacterium]|nr:HAMP domain-containing protein [Deltaproteobacteria bacterium]